MAGVIAAVVVGGSGDVASVVVVIAAFDDVGGVSSRGCVVRAGVVAAPMAVVVSCTIAVTGVVCLVAGVIFGAVAWTGGAVAAATGSGSIAPWELTGCCGDDALVAWISCISNVLILIISFSTFCMDVAMALMPSCSFWMVACRVLRSSVVFCRVACCARICRTSWRSSRTSCINLSSGL